MKSYISLVVVGGALGLAGSAFAGVTDDMYVRPDGYSNLEVNNLKSDVAEAGGPAKAGYDAKVKQAQEADKEGKKEQVAACKADKKAAEGDGAPKSVQPESCKGVDVSEDSPEGSTGRSDVAAPKSAAEGMMANSNGASGSFSTNNGIQQTSTLDTQATAGKFEQVKAHLGSAGDLTTAQNAMRDNRLMYNKATIMTAPKNTDGIFATAGAVKNDTLAVGMAVNSTDPKAPLRQSFMNKMINQYGMSPEEAAAYAGQIDTESHNFEPQKVVRNADGSYSRQVSKWGEMAQGDHIPGTNIPTSFGSAQFHLDRAEKMFDYVGAADGSKAELKGTLYKQWDFMGESDVPANIKGKNADIMKGDSSFYDKVSVATKVYENPANDASQQFGRAGGNERWANAKGALQEYYNEQGKEGSMMVAAVGNGKAVSNETTGSVGRGTTGNGSIGNGVFANSGLGTSMQQIMNMAGAGNGGAAAMLLGQMMGLTGGTAGVGGTDMTTMMMAMALNQMLNGKGSSSGSGSSGGSSDSSGVSSGGSPGGSSSSAAGGSGSGAVNVADAQQALCGAGLTTASDADTLKVNVCRARELGSHR